MFQLLPKSVLRDPNKKWLDPGSGTGNIAREILYSLVANLEIPFEERNSHVIKNMLHMVELNDEHIPGLQELFDKKANIRHTDYLTIQDWAEYFDVIVGNPPFNFNGDKKVPTANKSKKKDGKTIWIDFTKKALSMLKPDGYLLFILPSIWLKPDKAKMYDLLTSYKIHKIHCFNNTEANRIFKGEAQTPCCFFLLQKRPSNQEILIYDKSNYFPFYLATPSLPIPVFGVNIVNIIYAKTQQVGYLKVKKTNMPSDSIKMNLIRRKKYPFKNVNTCILDSKSPELQFRYSDKPCPYHGIPKLILAHGMYGFPYFDNLGMFGIVNRDKYVIYDYTEEELQLIGEFLSTKFALYIYEATRYRMKFLEKYAFQLIPDITKLENFPKHPNDENIADYFCLSKNERQQISNLHKKEYKWFMKN